MFDFGRFSVDELCYLGIALMLTHAVKGNEYLRDLKVIGVTPLDLLLFPMSGVVFWQCVNGFYEVNAYYNGASGIQQKRFYNERFYELGNVFVFHLSVCLWNTVD